MVALTIAGSDSGGGAGIQADLATFAAFGVHGTSAITAITVQDTTGVHAVHPMPAPVVVAQVQVVLADLPVAGVKTGMLGDVRTVRAVAELAAAGLLPRLVVDPVLVASSGDRLTSDAAASVLARELLPHALLVTPNIDEAAALLGTTRAVSGAEQRAHALALLAFGPSAVVVTGRVDGDDRVDVLAHRGRTVELRALSITTGNDHGTGCTFAAAAAAALARGADVPTAVELARDFVRAALAAAAGWRLGRGAGPVSHLLLGHPTFPITPIPSSTTPITDHRRNP